MDQPEEIVNVMGKIDRGIAFFRENFEFKKAEMYLRRFEKLRQTVLETRVYLKIIKILRDANTECNLRIVQTNIFDTAAKLEDVDPSLFIYPRINPKSEESTTTCFMLMKTLEEQRIEYSEFSETRIYSEYFDNRLYLLEQYLDCVSQILE
jgi:hypothetical protein